VIATAPAMPPDRDPLRLLLHALAAGDARLADLVARRLFPAARRTLLLLRRRLKI
jgi:hypothetical protein